MDLIKSNKTSNCKYLNDNISCDVISHTLSSALLPPVTSLKALLSDDDTVASFSAVITASWQAMQVIYSAESSLNVAIWLPSLSE